MTTIAVLTVVNSKIIAQTPYNREFVGILKRIIPRDYRRWDTREKVWVVSVAFGQLLYETCADYFDEVRCDTKIPKFLTNPQSTTINNPFIKQLSKLPKEILREVYKTVMFHVHPDRGGDPQVAREINEAWQKCK